jgi:glycosyltransferase involved in cell wall biosynthesis
VVTSKALVSVIVTCYNQGRYLHDSLGSLLKQSHDNWECIIINDGSTDDTEIIALQYSDMDPRFIYFYQDNGGVSSARNNGIRKSNGDFIQFLDADDCLHPDKFKTQLSLLNDFSQIDIVYGSSRYFFDGEPNVLYPLHFNGGIPCDLTYRDHFQVEMLLKHNLCTNCSALIRKKVIEVVGFKNVIYEDWVFNLECALNRFVFHFDSSFLSYSYIRITDSSQMTKHTTNLNKINHFDSVLFSLVKEYKYSIDIRIISFQNLTLSGRLKRFFRQLTPPALYDLAAVLKSAISKKIL